MTLPDEFIFMFIRYFNRVILLEKSCQKRGVWKKYKKGDGLMGGGGVYRRVGEGLNLLHTMEK